MVIDQHAERIDVDRVVCLALLDGPSTPGVPTDTNGFVPVDADGQVRGVADVYAIGDATAFPIKQGGLACQQADAVAEVIAAAAGTPIQPAPFRPVLRGKLMTGGRDRFLQYRVATGTGAGEISEQPLWWPPTKVASRFLASYLLDGSELDPRSPMPPASASRGNR